MFFSVLVINQERLSRQSVAVDISFLPIIFSSDHIIRVTAEPAVLLLMERIHHVYISCLVFWG